MLQIDGKDRLINEALIDGVDERRSYVIFGDRLESQSENAVDFRLQWRILPLYDVEPMSDVTHLAVKIAYSNCLTEYGCRNGELVRANATESYGILSQEGYSWSVSVLKRKHC